MATDILKKRMQRGVWFEAHSPQIVKLSLTLNILDWVFARFAGQLLRYKNYKWEEVGGGGGGNTVFRVCNFGNNNNNNKKKKKKKRKISAQPQT